jgi:ABC-type Fe3+ transport system substrate-binding protein
MNILGFAYPDAAEPDGKKADVWFIDGPSPMAAPGNNGCHLAWRAQDCAQVDAFYRAAIAAGAKTTVPWGFARNTTRITTAPSSSTRKATILKPCAISPRIERV